MRKILVGYPTHDIGQVCLATEDGYYWSEVIVGMGKLIFPDVLTHDPDMKEIIPFEVEDEAVLEKEINRNYPKNLKKKDFDEIAEYVFENGMRIPEHLEMIDLNTDQLDLIMLALMSTACPSAGLSGSLRQTPSVQGMAAWQQTLVSKIVGNVKYAGDVLTGNYIKDDNLTHKDVRNKGQAPQYYVEDHHKAIIPRMQFQRAQMIRKLGMNEGYPYASFLVCPYCGGKMERETVGAAKHWICEQDQFYMNEKYVDQAILTAYEKWEPENERAMAFKAQHPTMESAEFWWIDELVDRVTFGRHERDDDYTMTVRWLSGEETTVPSGEKDMKLVRKMFMKRRVRASHKRGRPKKEREKNAFEVLRASETFQIEPKGPILPEGDNIILVEGRRNENYPDSQGKEPEQAAGGRICEGLHYAYGTGGQLRDPEGVLRKENPGKPRMEICGCVRGPEIRNQKGGNRTGFNRMIADALEGKIDLILCKSISRWARNAVDSMKAIKQLTGNDVHIIFDEQGIDTRDPGNIFRLNIYSAIAQSESESISENCKWTYRNKVAQGKVKPKKNIYFGYNTDDGEFTPDENAQYVKLIYKRYLAGKSLRNIADELNIEGVKNVRGRGWSAGTIRNILHNEVYVGDMSYGKTPSRNVITGVPDEVQSGKYVKDHHKGIISREMWEAVQGWWCGGFYQFIITVAQLITTILIDSP